MVEQPVIPTSRKQRPKNQKFKTNLHYTVRNCFKTNQINEQFFRRKRQREQERERQRQRERKKRETEGEKERERERLKQYKSRGKSMKQKTDSLKR